jgi:RNA polymerase sigma factor (sigma-70 family)
MSDYRVNIKVRNARLLRAIEQAGHQPGQIFAGVAGISYSGHLLPYINLKRTPFDENGDLRPCAEKLCLFLRRMPVDLWSEEQRYPLTINSAEVELSGSDVSSLLASSMATCADPAVLLEQREAIHAVDDLLDALPSRDAEILRLRFGIDGIPMTLDEVAKTKSCTRERIRQIEAKALARLRKPAFRPDSLAKSFGIHGGAA